MMDIFLSASVPLPSRNRHYFETADVLSIREAIKSLVEVVLPNGRLTFGGHPAITPLIALFVKESSLTRDRLTIFQSSYYADQFPAENEEFYDVRVIEALENETESLLAMRHAMIRSREFSAAVLIGGMDGVLIEARMFSEIHPAAIILPVASTGAAAHDLYQQGHHSEDLLTDLTYTTLFRRQLGLGKD